MQRVMFTPEFRLARKEHPETSKDAAAAIVGKLNERQAETVAAVRGYPGKTASELEATLGKPGRHFGRRLPECASKGLVRRGEARVCRMTGTKAVTWWPA